MTAVKEEGDQVGRDRTIRKYTEEFRKLAERHKYCPQVYGLERSWITEIPIALDLGDQSLPELRAAPLGLLKRARNQMKAELDDPGTWTTSIALKGHCKKFLLITDRTITRIERLYNNKMDPKEKAERKGPLQVDTINQNGTMTHTEKVNAPWSRDTQAWIPLHWKEDENDLAIRTTPGEVEELGDKWGQDFLLCKLPSGDELASMSKSDIRQYLGAVVL